MYRSNNVINYSYNILLLNAMYVLVTLCTL